MRGIDLSGGYCKAGLFFMTFCFAQYTVTVKKYADDFLGKKVSFP